VRERPIGRAGIARCELRLRSVALVLLVTMALASQATAEEALCSRAAAALACPTDHSRALQVRLAVDADSTDVLHYRLDIEPDTATASLTGRTEMTVRVLATSLDSFTFQLDNPLAITALQVDGHDAAWQRLDSTNVRITLTPSRLAGDELVVAVSYQGRPDMYSGGIAFDSQGGWPLVWTLSEPMAAPSWWAVKDDNTDKATVDLLVTVQTGMSVAGNGTLVEEELRPGGKTRFHWRTDYLTAPYLVFFAASRYNRFGGTWQHDGLAMPLLFYVYPSSDTTTTRTQCLATIPMLDTLAPLFGPYPFTAEKYGIYQWSFPGGMEHQTMTGQNGFSETLTVHELAHQWWGDLVTCATWHDVWLNEGFATYAEALWAEYKTGSSGLAALRSAMAARRPRDGSGTVWVPDISDSGRIFSSDLSYRKGSWVLHMLRRVIGDEAFFNLLLRWREQYAFSSATTESFRDVAEAIHGGDLSWFFNEWVYSGGLPEYSLGWQAYSAAGRTWVDLSLQQVQASAPAFTMPLDVRLSSGSTTTDRVLWSNTATQHFLLPMGGPVDSVTLDPDAWVLTKTNTAVPFVEGPPRIVATEPAPGAWLAEATATHVSVTFHKDVAVADGDIALEGERGGPVECSLSYDRATTTATLTPLVSLPADRYTLTVSDQITDTASGQQLDGEVARPRDAAALPSGDGRPGGSGVIGFTVAAGPRRHLGAGSH
jgi:aminopeptidase N